MKRSLKYVLAFVALWLLNLPSASACSVCYGEPDSPMTRGLTWAIVVLAAIVGVVLAGVAMFFVHVNRRADGLQPAGQKIENVNLRS
jgi:hypothetical protein